MSPDLQSGWGNTPPPPQPQNIQGRGGKEREAPLSRLSRCTMTPYLHVFRLHEHLHIQKYFAIFPRLFIVCICMCTRACVRLHACGSSVSEGATTVRLCVCQGVYYMRNTRSCHGRGHVTIWNNIAKFVFDYCTSLIFC